MSNSHYSHELLRENGHFRSLFEKHQHLERQISDLTTRKFRSDDDHALESKLKKQKLHLKEEMDRIARTSEM